MMAKVVMAADSGVDVRGNFIRRSAQNARRNAKFLSNQAKTVRFTARIAFPKGNLKAAKLMLSAILR
jgi:hypothetical protein